MKFILLSIVLIAQFSLTAQTAKIVNPSSVHQPKGGYSHYVVIDLGDSKMIITAGQIALDKQGRLVGIGDFRKQAEQVYLNIKNLLAEEGGTMDNIVRTGTYLVDMSNIQQLREIRSKYLNTLTPPASTLVQVSKLFMEEAIIEIEVTAIVPKKK